MWGSREICYLLLQMVAARLCASIALISTRKLVVDLHKVGTCPVLVKRCAILMHISVWGPGRNILCFFSRFLYRAVFFCLHFHCYFVSLDLYSLLFCIKMKSETQNIYNFVWRKKKNVKQKKVRKWKLFFIVLAKMQHQEKRLMVTKILSFLHL